MLPFPFHYLIIIMRNLINKILEITKTYTVINLVKLINQIVTPIILVGILLLYVYNYEIVYPIMGTMVYYTVYMLVIKKLKDL